MRQTPISHAAMRTFGWTRVDPKPWGKLSARWSHVAGWSLVHCVHPTANTPWALYDPQGRLVLAGADGTERRADFGRAWPDLRTAADFVRRHLAGNAPFTGPFRTLGAEAA